MSVPTKNGGSIVSFAIHENSQPPCKRGNQRHDFLVAQLRQNETTRVGFRNYRGQRVVAVKQKSIEQCIKGPCSLRVLSNFEVARSFLIDSLHNIYLGLTVSTLRDIIKSQLYYCRNAFYRFGSVPKIKRKIGQFILV